MSSTAPLCPDGRPARLIELTHSDGVRLTTMDWGATWLSCRVAVGTEEREVLLGCSPLEDFFVQKAFLGAAIGRYANRIGRARMAYHGKEYVLTPNEGRNQLHGGPGGFDKQRWRVLEQGSSHVTFGIESPDGDQGFPGNLKATLTYRLDPGARIALEYIATVDAPCPVNLTNHAYFNLDGDATDIREHSLFIRGRKYLPIGEDLIPVGPLAEVGGTSFDFSTPKAIRRDFLADEQQRIARGYDHAYLLDPECREMAAVAATAVSADGRLAMDVYTTKPALQLYSGNYLAGVPGRSGPYAAHQGFALETEFLPDSPNHPEWPQPDCWLKPGETYKYGTVLAFRTK
ncbi:galactose-1-epimerase [Propionivibrio soli]|uniref:galactose-1-epimerase n=1 Tax=Propionivibrio soli TaxID=2976531 RepID=UPI0021E79278|nr:galactose-1-epimerase [Propionivibrio soli]